jgi:prevent-host-death family protein
VATINVHEAKAQLSKLLDRAHRGEEVVISKGGVPYARLVPLAPPLPRQAGWLVGELGAAFFEPLPEEELAAWDDES